MQRQCDPKEVSRDVRLVLALGASEPCYRAEGDDEDNAHEDAPAVAIVSLCGKFEDLRKPHTRSP